MFMQQTESQGFLTDFQIKNNLPGNRPIIFGEVLYDVFDSGKRILGGAPFNVAWHLHGMGLQPLMITCLGQDTNGENVYQTMQQWGLETTLVQRDQAHPTGTVQVSVTNGSPHFEIPPEQAYDYINGDQAIQNLDGTSCALLYHGTLALRHTVSRAALQTIADTLNLPIFLDINLRAPWWDKALVESSIKSATWLKVNEDEIAIIEPSFKNFQESEEALETLCQRYDLAMLVVTLGEKGALLKVPKIPPIVTTPPKVSVVDSVGAGDAFSAVLIAGLLQQWQATTLLERAQIFAATICQIRGATTMDKNLYQTTMTEWSNYG